MNAKNLFELIEKDKQERVVISFENQDVTVADIVELRLSMISKIKQKKINSIGICSNCSFEIALMLVCLDGLCEKIVIAPVGVKLDYVDVMLFGKGVDKSKSYAKKSIDLKSFLAVDKQYAIKLSETVMFHATAWVLFTSGTTGVPKEVLHNINSLTNSIKIKPAMDSVWGLFYKLDRFAGLQVFLQALLNSSRLVISEYDSNILGQIKLFANKGVNSISATPTMWRKLLMLPQSRKLKLENITLGGEIADSNILKALKDVYPLASIRHIYAATEVGSCFSVSDGLAGFPSSYFTIPPKNCSLKIGENGTLLVKSTTKGYIDTGDLVEIEGERCFFIGRESGIINVGGNKISPEKIEEILRSMPEVKDARAFAKSNSIMGQLVMVDVVRGAGSNVNEAGIIKFCKANLDQPFVPVRVNFVEEILSNNNGKVVRL